MTYIFAVIIFLMLMLNISIYRSFFHPAIVYSGIWFLSIFTIALSGNHFYEISSLTLFIFTFGVFVFSVSSFMYLLVKKEEKSSSIEYKVDRITENSLSFMIFLQLTIFPLYILAIIRLASLVPAKENFLSTVRAAFLAISRLPVPTLDSILFTFVPTSIIVANIAILEVKNSSFSKWRAWIAFIIALGFQILQGAASGAIILGLTSLGILWLKYKKISIRILFGNSQYVDFIIWINCCNFRKR